MRSRIVLAAAASAVALAAVVGVAAGGRDEARLVRTAGESSPIEELSTSPTPATEDTSVVAELDATVEDHEERISRLEATTTTTAPAAQATPTTATTAPTTEAVAEPSTTTTTTAPPVDVTSTTTTTMAPPSTTTTTFVPSQHRR